MQFNNNNNNRKNNNNKRNQRPNWFQTQIQNLGEDFLTRKNANDLQRDANRIIKDIGYGNVNINEIAPYFKNSIFTLAIKNAAYDNWCYNYHTANGLLTGLKESNQTTDPSLMKVYDIHLKASNAYSFVYKAMENIISLSQMNRDNEIADQLILLVKNLRPFKEGLNFTFIVIQN